MAERASGAGTACNPKLLAFILLLSQLLKDVVEKFSLVTDCWVVGR